MNWRAFALDQGDSSLSQAFCTRCGYSSATRTPPPRCSECVTLNCSGQEGRQRRWSTMPPFHQNRSRNGKWQKKYWRQPGSSEQGPPSQSCVHVRALKTRFLRAPWCSDVPQKPWSRRQRGGGATPQNSYGLSVSCIRVKNKILFERKGFSVNTQTSWKPPHGRTNFK